MSLTGTHNEEIGRREFNTHRIYLRQDKQREIATSLTTMIVRMDGWPNRDQDEW